jgi:hypothetical protein
MPVAAVLPAPPLAVPALVGGPDPATARLTDACLRLLAEIRPGPGVPVLLLGVGERTRTLPPGAGGTFGGLGVDLVTAVPGAVAGHVAGQPVPELSLSLSVGCWLLGQAWPGFAGAVTVREIAGDTPAPECAELGARWAAEQPGAVWVVLADGSTVRISPVVDERSAAAGALDDAVAAALADGDAAWLSALGQAEAAAVGAAGRAAWQVLAGAVGGAPVQAEIRYAAAPYGVGYHVARWQW